MNRTRWFIVAIGVIIAIYDVWTLNAGGYETTISWQLYTWMKEWPIIGVAMGILVGHLSFPNRAANAPSPQAIPPPNP